MTPNTPCKFTLSIEMKLLIVIMTQIATFIQRILFSFFGKTPVVLFLISSSKILLIYSFFAPDLDAAVRRLYDKLLDFFGFFYAWRAFKSAVDIYTP